MLSRTHSQSFAHIKLYFEHTCPVHSFNVSRPPSISKKNILRQYDAAYTIISRILHAMSSTMIADQAPAHWWMPETIENKWLRNLTCLLFILFFLVTSDLSKGIRCHAWPYSFLCLQITRSDVGSNVGYQPGDCRWIFNLPQGFVWVCMGWHTHFITLEG